MAKKGVLRITGNTSPRTGEKTFYKVTEWYPDTPLSERKESLVTWELFRKRENGKFTTTNIKKKVGEFTFGKDAWKYTFRVEGYLDKPEGKEPMSIIVQPQKNNQKAAPKEKDILGVKLTFHDGSPVNKKLSYRDRLWATAKCQGLEGEHIVFTLWEDDERGDGHNKKNQSIVKSPPIPVDSQGYARWNFTLLNTYIAIANKREDDKKQHEYYVTAEYNGKMKASDNANANNPEYKAPSAPPKPTGGGKPQPKPDSPKGSTRTNSPNNQPDKKGVIKQIKLTDKNGKEFTKNPKFGETIRVSIDSYNLVGKKYTLKIWEHDLIGDDLLYSKDHTFLTNHVDVLIPLTEEMQKTGEIGNDPKNPDSGEYWKRGQQEIFAEVIFVDLSAKSQTIDVDILEAPKPQNNGNTANAVKDQPKPEIPKTGKCFCNREFTPKEFEKIIHGLRDSEKRVKQNSGYDLFNASNCNIKAEDRTIEKLRFQINAIFDRYNINTCLRKLHFLSQIYHETDRLRTAKEYADGIKYDPGKHPDAIKNGNTAKGDGEKYKGRGLMQLTWKDNYKIYKSYSGIDVITNYQNVSDILSNACQSAGWYWKQGKILSVGTRWKGPADAPTYVKIHKPDYPKNTITWEDDGKKKKYGTVDMGLIADDDKVDLISYLVNGGANGLQERRNYVITLKTLFEYPQNCENKAQVSPPPNNGSASSLTIRLVRKWQTKKSTIGEFTIDNTQIKGFILEEKGPDTTDSGKEQRVPIGTYNLEWHSGTKIKKGLKLFSDVVSKDRAILIHSGNTADDTEGCLLPGTTRSADFVGGSKDKLKEIFTYVEEVGIKNAKIIITQAYE